MSTGSAIAHIHPTDVTTMKKHLLICGLIAASLVSVAQAKTGTITFSGSLTAASCKVSITGGTSNTSDISINMGQLSISDLKDKSTIDFSAATQVLPLTVTCTDIGALKSVTMNFEPAHSVSGLDTNDTRLLAVDRSNAGVGIALFDGVAKKILDLKANESLTANLTPKSGTSTGEATAEFTLGAAYVNTGSATAGDANASLPFTLSYL